MSGTDEKERKKYRQYLTGALVMLLIVLWILWSGTAFAEGEVAEVIESTWKNAAAQIKEVVNEVVFPAIDLVLVISFFAKVGLVYFDYRKHGQFEWTGPVILFVCLVFSLTAPLYIWQIVGI